MTMKTRVILCLIGITLLSSKTFSSDSQAVYDTHLAWKTAFEKMDMGAIRKIWSHEKDTMLITLGGEKKEGWDEIQAELLFSFKITGETQIDESNLLITLSGDKASATSDYRWNPLPNVPLKTTELYRKEQDVWKMIAQDGAGGLDPLRPDDGIRLRPLVEEIHGAIAGADIDKLLPLVADNDFVYVALSGAVDHEFSKAIVSDDLAKIQKIHLAVVYLIDEVATAHLTLTLVGNNEQKAQFVIKNFQLTKLDFAPNPLAIQPRVKLTTTWAQIKRGKM